MRALKMKYRTKIYLALVITALLSTIVGLSIVHYQVKKMVLGELRINVMSIAAGTVASLDGSLIQTLQTTQDQNSSEYNQLQTKLRQIRDANRRDDIYVKYLYILTPKAHDKQDFTYLVDAEDKSSKDFSPIGEEADEAATTHLKDHVNQVYSPKDFIVDNWGDWMMGYAPIFDKNGRYIATVGVNLYATDIIAKLNNLFKYGVISFLATLMISLFFGWHISKRQTESLDKLHEGVKAIGSGDLKHEIKINTKDEFGQLADDINVMSKGLIERERLLMSFTRYVSQHIMDTILKSEGQIKLTGESKRVTVLFSDIRNFTSFSEKHPPEVVVSMLNEYFSVMVEVVFRNQGILDKFLGDGMMVEFGAPLDDGMQEYHAVKAALEMHEELAKLCSRWKNEGRPEIEIGIGIHSGNAVIGNIGSEKRVEYTAIGDTVNVASRIEQLNKELHTNLLVSESTMSVIWDKFDFKEVGAHQIRGRSELITLYTIESDINKKKERV